MGRILILTLNKKYKKRLATSLVSSNQEYKNLKG